MGRKVFISVLGTGNYKKCRYQSSDESVCIQTKFAQKAALMYVNAQEWTENDRVFILLTKNARNKNWTGLSRCLRSLRLPCPIQAVSIVDGKEIFIKYLHPTNASAPIVVSPSLILTSVMLFPLNAC